MNSVKRRKLLTMACAGESIEDPLLSQASEWVDRLRGRGTTILVYPVSRLQREFSLGYARACALADRLAQRGKWTPEMSTLTDEPQCLPPMHINIFRDHSASAETSLRVCWWEQDFDHTS